MPHYSSDTGRLIADDPRRYVAEQINLLWQHLGQIDDTLAKEPTIPEDQFTELLTRTLPSQTLNVNTIRTLIATRVELIADTHALRPAPVNANQLFWETDRQHLFYTAASGSGFVWTVMPLGEMRGTLSPDQKPSDLGTADEGFRFFSTDFFRSYRWTGAAWLDTGDELSRRSIVWFDAAPEPTTGWQLCDGTATTRSTSVGGTAAFTVPDLTTGNRFLRSVSGATGGTSGAATHVHTVDPPNTTTGDNNAASNIQSGGGANVAADTHVHDVDIAQFNSGASSSLPPAYNANPFIRL